MPVTEPTRPAGQRTAGRRVHWLSARTRILAWLLALLTFTGAGVLLVAGSVLLRRADERVTIALEQEYGEFRQLADNGRDPATGEAFATAAAVLDTFLARQYPNPDEVLLTVSGGRVRYTPDTPDAAALARAAPVAAMTARSDDVATGEVASTTGRTARYLAVPVTSPDQPGAAGHLVIAVFPDNARGEAADTVRVLGTSLLAALVAAGVIGWIVAGRILEPVRLVRRAAQQITETDLSQRIPVSGRDDIADLAATFNAMLDRLEDAFGTQRRFLDDAGHELRTPITIVRGHLELMGDDSAERRETLALVDDELVRMQRIVGDLLLLAKSAMPDFVVPAPVDLVDLVTDIVTKARVLGDRRWQIDALAEGEVMLDRQRVTQALVQLLDNAVRHTGAGDEVAIGSRVVPGTDRVQLWVRDTGPGVAPSDAERIFERFSRAGTGARRGDGAGLGLSIVQAIAEAHGGRVVLDSRPGRGATFRLDLAPAPVVRRPVAVGDRAGGAG